MPQETSSSPNALQRKTCDYLLVRHLKPEVEAGICYGQSDLPAAEVPDPAWQELMAFRSDLPLLSSPLLSSPLQRARTLADHLSALQRKSSEAPAPASIAEDHRWQELDFGDWEGLSWQQIGQDNVESWQQNLLGFQFPNGESALQMQQRVLSAWRDWLRQRTGGVLVTHLGVIRMLLGQVLQIPFQQQLMLQIDYQKVVWLQQSWLEDNKGVIQPGSEVWQLKGVNLSADALLR